MAQRCENATRHIKHHKARVSHHILDVVTEDPQVEHIADEVHPAAVHEHAGQQGAVGGDPDGDRWGEIRLAEEQRRNRAILEDEGLSMPWWEARLVKKYQDANNDECDRDDGSEFGGIVVLERDHAATGLGGVAAAVNDGSR